MYDDVLYTSKKNRNMNLRFVGEPGGLAVTALVFVGWFSPRLLVLWTCGSWGHFASKEVHAGCLVATFNWKVAFSATRCPCSSSP